jgi:hypothetical protein
MLSKLVGGLQKRSSKSVELGTAVQVMMLLETSRMTSARGSRSFYEAIQDVLEGHSPYQVLNHLEATSKVLPGIVIHDVEVPEVGDHLVVAYHPDADTSGSDIHNGLNYLRRNQPDVDWQSRLFPAGFSEKHMIGYARFHTKTYPSTPRDYRRFASDSYVDSDWRRRGVATAMYSHANKQFPIEPSIALSGDARKFWKSKPLN